MNILKNILSKMWVFAKFVWHKPLWSYCFEDKRGWAIAWRSFVGGVLFMAWVFRTTNSI